MGGCASKKVEAKLRESAVFQAAVDTSFQDCLAISQHAASGVFLYQLLDASCRIYHLIPSKQQQQQQGDVVDDDDPAPLLKEKWLLSPPSQPDVDRTIRQEGLAGAGKQTLTLEEFHFFAVCVFRDMAVASAEQRLAFYVPVGTLAVLAAHLTARRLPVVGPAYRRWPLA